MLKVYYPIIFVLLMLSSSLFTPLVKAEDGKTPISQVIGHCTFSSDIIPNVPYVSQETDFYCTYACPTMVLKYYGYNTSLDEFLYYSGAGYSLVYSHPKVKRFLISCVGSSNWEMDRRFTGELFGLSYSEDRLMEYPMDESQRWNLYWNKLKENITSGCPVITIVDPSCLSSVQSAIQHMLGIPDVLWNMIPAGVFSLFPSTMTHMITIVGFNEENNSICYNDPSAALFGDASFGTYAWMNVSLIRRSMLRISSISGFAYMIGAFHKNNTISLSFEDRLYAAHGRNIKKMNGDPGSYDEQILRTWDASSLGINGLRSLKNDLGPGIDNRPTTVLLYKMLSTLLFYSFSYKVYRFFDRFFPSVLNLSDFNEQMNYVHQLSIEKHDISDWLFSIAEQVSDPSVADMYYSEAVLLHDEAFICEQLAENFSLFLQKGIWLSYPKAVTVIEHMSEHVSEMIEIEETILKQK